MRKILALALLAVAASAARAGEPFELRRPGEVGDDDLSPLARRVLAAGGPWTYAESAHFIVHAESAAAVTGAVAEAEYALQKALWYVEPRADRPLSARRVAGGGWAGPKARLFVIEKPDTWAMAQQAADPSKYSLAMQVNNEVFALRDTNMLAHVLRVPHEMVHLAMWRVYGRRLPLWLEEGTAAYLGWRIAEAYRGTPGRLLVRALPPVRAGDVRDLDALTATWEYPETRGAGVAFYRGAEELVRAIARRVGDDRLDELLEAGVGGTPWREVLEKQFGFTADDLSALESEVRMRTLSEATD